jgi:hypothetical protein
MTLRRVPLDDLQLLDEQSFRHVGVYRALKRAIGNPEFAVLPVERADHALLLNLGFWRPGDLAEVLPDEFLTADQLAHNAWHIVAARKLGAAAHSTAGMLLAEAIASAFDVYLVGRVLGHAPNSPFLTTQVPPMADAAQEAGLDQGGFEALLVRFSEEPEAAFESLRRLLFDTASGLVGAADVDAAAAVLERADEHELAPLLHHFAIQNWILFARTHADGAASGDAALEVDRALRAASSSIDWLEANWLAS